MPNYFENLQDTEISGGDFTSVSGDFVVGTEGTRRDAGVPREKPEPTNYFANGKGLKITGGNFMSFGGSFYDGHSRSQHIPMPPRRPGPVPLAPQHENYGGYTYPRPSTPQRPAAPQQDPYNYYGGGYGDPYGSQNIRYHYPYPNQPADPPPPSETHTNVVRPPLLQSQSGPAPSTGAPHFNANLSASVEFTHTRTEPNPPSQSEHPIRPPSGLDVPNHRPINPTPSINIWAQRPGEIDEYVISDSDSDDENKKKKKKKKGGMSSMTELSQQFKKVFNKINE